MTDVVFLGRVVVLATHESSPSGDDSFGVAQQLLHGPSAASSENRSLGVVTHPHLPITAGVWMLLLGVQADQWPSAVHRRLVFTPNTWPLTLAAGRQVGEVDEQVGAGEPPAGQAGWDGMGWNQWVLPMMALTAG